MSCDALAQRGHANRHDAETIVQILAEPAVGDELVEPPVRRRDDARGHPDRLLAADALELAVLQDAQQLRLRRLVQISDFVEKDRAAVGQLELAAPERRRAGERPLLVAEELALDQLGRNRGAIHLHERTRGERAFAMDVGGQQLLAGPGLSRQQHADVGPRHLGRLLHGLLERGRRSDHPRRVPDQLAVALVLALQVRPLERVLDDQQHAVARERLLEELERAHLRRLNRVGHRAVTGDHHGSGSLIPLPHRAQQVDAAAIGQPHVEQVDVGGRAAAFRRERRRRVEHADAIALALQDQTERPADVRLVVDDDDVPFAWS